MPITRKGRYRVTDPNTGQIYEHNRLEEAYDKAIEVGAEWINPPDGWEVMGFRINTPPPPEQEINASPVIISQPPSIAFTVSNVGTYNLAQHFSDDGVSVVTYSVSPSLGAGLTLNSSTGLLTYDGVGAANANTYTATIDDGVNPPVNTLSFSITVSDPPPVSQDIIHAAWTHNLEPLGVVPNDFVLDGENIWGLSSSPNSPQPDGTGFWIDDGTRSANGLMVAGTRQFHTVLVKNGAGHFRTERSHQREPRNVKAVSAGTHFDPILNANIEQWKAPQKYWYGFIMRIDRADHRNQGYFCQWHTNAAAGGSPVLALQMRTDGLQFYMEKNPDLNGNYDDDVQVTVVPTATLYGVTHAYIWEIFWDTRHASMGSEGIVRLYIDDNTTPAFEWLNKNNNQQAGVGSPAELPYFKWGLYKSAFKSQGVDGDTHIQQHTNFTVMGEGGSRQGMLDAMMFDQII